MSKLLNELVKAKAAFQQRTIKAILEQQPIGTKEQHRAMTMPSRTPIDSWTQPTDAEINSACFSYRHDYGLLSEDEKKRIRFQAKEWLHVWRKELKE